MSPTAWVRAACVALLVPAGGCGPRLYPVAGTVVLEDGTPVTEGVVVMETAPAGGRPPVMARGRIRPDGRFDLSTTAPGDGVPAGTYRAVIVPPKQEPDAPPRPLPFDRRYTDPGTSGLEYVIGGGPTQIPIRLAQAGKPAK